MVYNFEKPVETSAEVAGATGAGRLEEKDLETSLPLEEGDEAQDEGLTASFVIAASGLSSSKLHLPAIDKDPSGNLLQVAVPACGSRGSFAYLGAQEAIRSSAHLAWQSSPNAATKARLTEARKASRDAVRRWKSEWWSTRLSRLEQSGRVKDAAAMFGEAQSLARLLQANGLCRRALHKGSDVELQRRRQHFHNVLTVNRQFNPGVWQELPQLSHLSAMVDWQAPS